MARKKRAREEEHPRRGVCGKKSTGVSCPVPGPGRVEEKYLEAMTTYSFHVETGLVILYMV